MRILVADDDEISRDLIEHTLTRAGYEVEAVRDVLGSTTPLTGFYSYGEISPFTPQARCELHNQTMTVTTLSER